MVRNICTSFLFVSLISVSAFACADDKASLFSCVTEDQQHVIQVCAVRDDAAGGYQSVRYVYGTTLETELTFPENRREGKSNLRFSHYFDKTGHRWRLRFDNKGYNYRIYADAGDAGVDVFRKNKKISTVKCGEAPVMSPDDIRRATSCDTDNPFGAAGCSDSPPMKR